MYVLPNFLSFDLPKFLIPTFLISGRQKASVRQPGAGVFRATARLVEHRKTFGHVDLTPTPSRQQRRAQERANIKGGLHSAKIAALKGKRMGGAAACR